MPYGMIFVNIGSGNGLSHYQRQTISWTTFYYAPLRTNLSYFFYQIKIIHFYCKKMHLEYHISTGDPLHSRALAHSRAPLFTQPCPHCSHSRAPGEQWARLCVFTLQGCVQAARLCRGSPVISGNWPFCSSLNVLCLTHWGRDKMATVSQTTLSNAFSWMKMLEFRLRFHWSLFLRVQLTIIQHWFR